MQSVASFESNPGSALTASYRRMCLDADGALVVLKLRQIPALHSEYNHNSLLMNCTHKQFIVGGFKFTTFTWRFFRRVALVNRKCILLVFFTTVTVVMIHWHRAADVSWQLAGLFKTLIAPVRRDWEATSESQSCPRAAVARGGVSSRPDLWAHPGGHYGIGGKCAAEPLGQQVS